MKSRYALLVIFALMILYSAYFSVYSIHQHNTFRTHASDLGQVDQALWNTLQGRYLEDTKIDGRQANRMTDHVEPTFALMAVSYIFYDGVEAILVAQSIIIALGALPIFWIARRRVGAALAAAQGNRKGYPYALTRRASKTFCSRSILCRMRVS